MQLNRSILLRWCIWFFLGNSLLFWLIGLNYLSTISWLGSGYFIEKQTLLLVFMVLTYLGFLGILALAPCMFFFPLIVMFPYRKFILPFAVVVATVAGSMLVADTIAYQLYRFHLNGIIINLILNGWDKEFLDVSSSEIASGFFVLFMLGLLEWLYATWLWRRFNKSNLWVGMGKWAAILLGLSLYYSYLMIIFSVNYIVNRAFLEMARVFPLYNDVLGAMLPMKNGKVALERLSESYLVQPAQAHSPLKYPAEPLQYISQKRHLNIVMIVIDAWRFDMLRRDVMPNLTQFSDQSWVYTNHYSGGNATGPGIFSLFYGIPSTYWTAMEHAKQGPVLIDRLLEEHYQMGIFSSAALNAPAFHRTVFRSIEDLSYGAQKGKTPDERDRLVTNKFSVFLKKAIAIRRPFFSFLFYDAAHGYCLSKTMSPFKPVVKICNRATLTNSSDPRPYLNRYQNALMFIDNEIKRVIDLLKANNLLDTTLVIVTGDHGEEFNDNHLGYWGHASNFTHYQVQTPLVVYWPGKGHHIFSHQTSHYDLSPTLMTKALGCQADLNKFSFGKNLHDNTYSPYLIIGSYIGFGILEPGRITEIFPTGNFHIEQLNAAPDQEAKLNGSVMQKVLWDLRRFYKT